MQSDIRIGTDDVTSSAFVLNLEIDVDDDVSIRTNVAKTVLSCFAVLLHLRSIRRFSLKSGHAVTRRRASTNPLGLWKCNTRWTRRSVTRYTAISPQRCRSFDLVAQFRSRDATSMRATLAAFSAEDIKNSS